MTLRSFLLGLDALLCGTACGVMRPKLEDEDGSISESMAKVVRPYNRGGKRQAPLEDDDVFEDVYNLPRAPKLAKPTSLVGTWRFES